MTAPVRMPACGTTEAPVRHSRKGDGGASSERSRSGVGELRFICREISTSQVNGRTILQCACWGWQAFSTRAKARGCDLESCQNRP